MRNITNALEALGESLNKLKYVPELMLCLIVMSLTVIAAPSNLDPSFGILGKVVSSPDGLETTFANDMALQADGKIVMVGNRLQFASGIIIARYNANGSLDTTFGTNGWSAVTFGLPSESATKVAIQADGKIVVGGTVMSSTTGSPPADFGLVRLNADGSLDTTFDGDGKLIISFNDLLGSSFYSERFGVLKIASDGKIVVGGTALNAAVDDKFIFARLNTDGSLDTAFGNNGRFADAPMNSNQDRINDMVILPDGKLVVAGGLVTFISSVRIVIKYSVNGVRDWTYSQSNQTGVPNNTDALNGIAALPDGKFIVVGKRLSKVVALRLNADGTQDNSFISPAGLPNGEALSVAIQADGKIVAALTANTFSLIRFNADGSLDTAFGNSGIVNTSVSGGQDAGIRVLIQPDGKILLGGLSRLSSPTRYYFAMVRYLGTFVAPKPIFDYDNDGRADVSVFRPSENKWFVLRSTDLGLTAQVFAAAGDIPVPADYDGDSKTDFAVFRPATGDWWYSSSVTSSQIVTHWGQSGDVPRPSDFDGDGKSDFILFRPSDSVWYRLGSTGAISISGFGLSGDKPVTGDFDGDAKSDLAIYRPSTGDWWYQSSMTNAQLAIHWGTSTDVPAPADYDGDGKTDVAVYRPSNGTWYILNSSNGSSTIMSFGVSEDKPVPADYDGDTRADIAVFRPSTGTWYLQQTTAGFSSVQWGTGSDIPTENAFIP